MGRNNADFQEGHGMTPEVARSFIPTELDITRDFQGKPTTAGMVPTHIVAKYMEFDRGSENPAKVDRLAKDIAENGIQNPLQIEYSHEHGWGTLAEGNHRLAAAIKLGLTHVPIVVTSSFSGETREHGGAPLHLREGQMKTPPAWMTHRNPPYFRQAHPSAFHELGSL